jgi:GC-rich sequence DNA-binding factor
MDSVPVARPMPTIGPAQARLAKSMATLELAKTEGETSLENNVRELAALEEQERELRVEVEKVEGKREWVDEFRGWVEMLGGFLEEKVGSAYSLNACLIV